MKLIFLFWALCEIKVVQTLSALLCGHVTTTQTLQVTCCALCSQLVPSSGAVDLSKTSEPNVHEITLSFSVLSQPQHPHGQAT